MAQQAANMWFELREKVRNAPSFAIIKKQVVELLKLYPKLNGKFNAAKRKSEGKGLFLEKYRLDTQQFDHLAAIGRLYVTEAVEQTIHKEKAERLFQHLAHERAEAREELDEISGLMTGTVPFGGEGYAYNGIVYPTQEAALEQAKADALEEMQQLQLLRQTIEEAMEDLKSYAPHLEKVLRLRYLEGKTIKESITVLGIETRTQDNWHREAIREIAPLLGFSCGW